MTEFNGRLTDSGQVVTDPLEFSRLGVEESALVLLSFSASNVGHDEEESHPEWTILVITIPATKSPGEYLNIYS